jgi:membrane-bound metal-dependent hydrolase YbcI (DUF457 family)
MTPVGHSLVGAALGVSVMPRGMSLPARAAFLAGFVVLANLPDARLPFWGHDRYDVSHSLFVTLALCALGGGVFLLLRSKFPRICRPSVLLGGAAAWLSHLLLDSFYSEGQGIGIFWPLSAARLALPLPWFHTLPAVPPPFTKEILRIGAVELLFYSPLLLIAGIWRHCRSRRLDARKDSGRKKQDA